MAGRRRARRKLGIKGFSREEFLARRWQYRPGEHATFIGKTQSGKTTLAMQLLDRTTTPDLPGIVLVMKPRDPTPTKWTKTLGYDTVRTWPPTIPPGSRFNPRHIRGYTLWPKMGDIGKDKAVLQTQFRAAMAESYHRSGRGRRGQNRIIFADEVVGISRELKLGDELDAIWMRGSGMGLGLWAACQRPFTAPLNAYEQTVHLFLWRSTDQRNRRRFAEIGGIDADLIDAVVSQLEGHDCMYINRVHYTTCIVRG